MSLSDDIDARQADTLGAYTPDQVLVVIPTFNEAAHIESCLHSLIFDDPFAAGCKIVVVDGSSTDSTQEIVKRIAVDHPDLHLIDNPDRIQSAGINLAVNELASPDQKIIVRCDAHSVYPKGFVKSVVSAFERHPEAASVASVMDAKGTRCFQSACAWIVDTPLGSGGSAHRGGGKSGWVDHGHHAGFRLEWFQKIGGYDPKFSHNEDAEYDHRLGLAGGRVWLEKDIRSDYQMRPSLYGTFLQYWRYGRGRARTIRKHNMRPRLRQIVPVINLLLMLLCVLLATVHTGFLLWPAFYIYVLAAVSVFAAIRMKSLCGVLAGPALFTIHNAWAGGFLRQWLAAPDRPDNP